MLRTDDVNADCRYLGVPHPFMHMTDYLRKARDYDEDIILALKVAHGL